MTEHVMLDLETMSTGSYAAIIAIGACTFDPSGDGAGGTFYMPVNLSSSMSAGLRVDADTIGWWLDAKQAKARERWLKEDKVNLDEALLAFEEWYRPTRGAPIWGNGAAFDNVVLANAYLALGFAVPWHYSKERCFRTLNTFIKPAVPADEGGVKHHALDDAVAQAMQLQKIVRLRQLTVE